MDPNETYRLWLAAVKRKDTDAAVEHYGHLSEWLARGGFEPKWSPAARAAFERWSPPRTSRREKYDMGFEMDGFVGRTFAGLLSGCHKRGR